MQVSSTWTSHQRAYSLNMSDPTVSISQAPLLGIFKKFPFSDPLIPSIFFSLSNPGLQSLSWSRGTPRTGHQSVENKNDRFPSRFLLWVFEIRSGEWAPQLWIGSFFYSSTSWYYLWIFSLWCPINYQNCLFSCVTMGINNSIAWTARINQEVSVDTFMIR